MTGQANEPQENEPQDLCDHGCGDEATVQHADGRFLCYPCYRTETDGGYMRLSRCPTCSPARPVVSPPDSTEAERVAEIQARVDAATEGPWEACGDYERGDVTVLAAAPDDPGEIIAELLPEEANRPSYDVEAHYPNAEFIAHAREDIPYLLGLLPASPPSPQLAETLRHVDECFENDGSAVTEMVREAKRITDAWATRNEDARRVSALLAGILPPLCDASGVVRAALASVAVGQPENTPTGESSS